MNRRLSLKKQFSSGTIPEKSELNGYFAVKWVPPLLPEIRFFGHQKYFPDDVANPNQGKGGFNRFLNRIHIGNFKTDIGKSGLGDGETVLKIIYNREGNPFWLRVLTDEIKKIKEGYFLGRGVISLFGITFNSFYFSVVREPAPASVKNGIVVIKGRNIRIFNAVTNALIPRGGEFEAGAADYDLVPRTNDILSTFDPAFRFLVPFFLKYVEWYAWIKKRTFFTRLPEKDAIRILENLENSRIFFHRAIIVVLRLLTAMTFYEIEEIAEEIGYVHGCHLAGEKGEAV